MSTVCIDTQILYWSVVKKAAPGAEELMPLAGDFMKWIDANQHNVLIPTIVVGEMLIPIPDQDMPKVLEQFSADWMIVPYDLKAANIFSRLRREIIIKNRIHDIRKLHPDVTKRELSADLMIVATAIANEVDCLYSHNEDMRSIAEGFIITKNFLDENFQMSMRLPTDGKSSKINN